MRRPRRIHAGAPERPGSIEFCFGTSDALPVAELAESFLAIDRAYSSLGTEDRLAVKELRTGSIIATLAPYLPMMGQALPALSALTTISDFSRKLKKAIDGFAELDPKSAPPPPADPIASEIEAMMKPLAGKKEASFKIARVQYHSRTEEREVKVIAEYGSDDINRAVINAQRYRDQATLQGRKDAPIEERNFVKGVAIVLHQANSGPAKAKGTTGDRGVIEAVSDKALPVYFAEGVNRLKDRMVKSSKNPLKYVYVVDAGVHRDQGMVKAYTVTEVISASLLSSPRSRAG